MDMEDLEEIGDLQMKSQSSRDRVKVLFKNETSKGQVKIFWLNYQGDEVDYGLIGHSEAMIMNTFLTHPWVCRLEKEDDDAEEEEEYGNVFFQWPDSGKLRPVFEAQKFVEKMWQENDEELQNDLQHFLNGQLRMDVIIRNKYSPSSLVDYVANILTDQPWVTLDSVASLGLPATLSEQLKADILRKRPLLTQVVC
jgi:hypothetical protein